MTDPFATPGETAGRYGDAEQRAEVPRDQWDRYRIPRLDGTMPPANQGFTRVSTIKDAILNKRGVERWKNRMVARGLTLRPDLLKAATEAVRDDDTKALGAVVESAYAAGGGKDRAGLGTVVHDTTERKNKGEEVHVPEEYTKDFDAYYRLLAENHVRVLPEFMERVVLCPYNSAGTFDNIVEWFDKDGGELDDDGKPVGEWQLLIADLKTGRDLSLGWLEILIQLWLYANAYGVLDLETNTYTPMPREVRKDRAMIIHVPMSGGAAELFILDLSGVEQYVQAAVVARRGNTEAKHKVRSVGRVTPAPFVVPGSAEWLAQNQPLDVPGHSTGPELAAKEAGYSTPQQRADAETAARRLAQVQSFRTPDDPSSAVIVPGSPEWAARTGAQQRRDAETAARRLSQVPHPYEGASGQVCTVCGIGPLGPGNVHTPPVQMAQIDPFHTPGPITGTPEQSIAETVGLRPTGGETSAVQQAACGLDGKGKPLGPMADKSKGERGCGVCGRKGHRSTSKACLGQNDPALLAKVSTGTRPADAEPGEQGDPGDPPAEPIVRASEQDQQAYDYAASTISPAFAAALAPNHPVVGEQGPEQFQVGDTATVGGITFTKHSDGLQLFAPGDSPWCDVSQHRSQGWTADQESGMWVCPTCKRPSRENWERAQVDPIAAEIEACTEPPDVLAVKARAFGIGKWTDAYDQQAKLKHQALSWPTP